MTKDRNLDRTARFGAAWTGCGGIGLDPRWPEGDPFTPGAAADGSPALGRWSPCWA